MAAGIGEKAREHPGQVLEMEAGGGDPARTFPKKGIREGRHEFIHLQLGL
jgi:hypothetical protein